MHFMKGSITNHLCHVKKIPVVAYLEGISGDSPIAAKVIDERIDSRL